VAKRNHTPEEHTEIVRAFAHLIFRYREIYLPGPDVGTNDADMKTIAIEKGIDNAVSKPSDMGGSRIDELGAAGGGVVIAIQALLKELPRLKSLPQFSNVIEPEQLTFLIQGFGAVGAHAAKILIEKIPEATIMGISDLQGYLYRAEGLPVELLFQEWQERGLVTRNYFESSQANGGSGEFAKFGSEPNDLLRESAFCMIPAAPIANYMDTVATTNPCITVAQRGNWTLIVEGANTYSPDPARKHARARMERAVYREGGVLIATDYLVNSGGVIFGAQERLIKTPDHLRFPESILGDREAVESWLGKHQDDLEDLAEQRRIAGEELRDKVICQNMTELVDLLISDADMLPNEAAEYISVQRIARNESDRTAVDIMTSIPIIDVEGTVQQAAEKLVDAQSAILAVVSAPGGLEGVITEWDITRATATGCSDDSPLSEIMTRSVVAATPEDGILTILRKMEDHEISAMPVVDDQKVLGMVCTDILARRSLLRLLQTQEQKP
jgi:glutamate dehydrogenase (NAD(P)+)